MMKNIFQTLLKLFSNIWITVICLSWLFILTFWGTVAQVDHGLYASQERYFNSMVFFVAKVIPMPGAQLTMWVLFVNLVASAITHFSKLRHWRYVGLKISHIGMLIYFVAAFITFHVSVESSIRLEEGESTNVSSSYEKWELAYWQEAGDKRQVRAIEITPGLLRNPQPLVKNDFELTIDRFYPNVSAYSKALPASGEQFINGSGISMLQPKPLNKEREMNMAGIFLTIKSPEGNKAVQLYGAERFPTKLILNGKVYYFILQRLKYELPFTIKLNKFVAQYYPGTSMAKSYESFVTLQFAKGAERESHIYMNNPLRFKDYAFYQASFDTSRDGKQASTLAVVKNSGSVLPYIACFVVFIGLTVHFLIMAFYRRVS